MNTPVLRRLAGQRTGRLVEHHRAALVRCRARDPRTGLRCGRPLHDGAHLAHRERRGQGPEAIRWR